MTNSYFNATGVPAYRTKGTSALIRAEFASVTTGFTAVEAAIALKANLAGGNTFTGTQTMTAALSSSSTIPTAVAGTNTTQPASTAFVTAAASVLDAAKANIASPTFTGVPAAPTAAPGTNTTQLATTAFVDAIVTSTAFLTALPSQPGNAGKFVKTDGTNASWANIGISSVTTATTATTLTSTATLLKITPASYGVAVTLPDATTCSIGGPIHIIDNKGAYPVKVLNSAGTLLGFIDAGVVSHISLIDNSTAAGVWSIENNELTGCTSEKTLTIYYIHAVVGIGNNREIILYSNTANANIYGIVYNATTNAYSSATLIRSASLAAGNVAACKVIDDKVLVVSCTYSTTSFEAVVVSINPSTDAITPGTAATATLSANINVFADGCGLIQVGTSFIASYTVATPAAQIREITVSGTTPTISAATALDGTAGGLIIAGDATHVIAVSTATTHLYTKPYTIGGLAAGTGTDTSITSGGLVTHLGAMSTGRFFIGHKYATSSYYGAILTLSGTTTTISSVTLGSGSLVDAIIVSSTKVLVTSSDLTANILTDSSGTASAGTQLAIGCSSCLYVTGSDVVVQGGTTTYEMKLIDCSGTSPTVKKIMAQTYLSNVDIPVFNASNSMLSKSPDAVYATDYARTITRSAATINFAACAKKDVFSKEVCDSLNYSANTAYRGTSDRSRWLIDSSTIMTKIERAA